MFGLDTIDWTVTALTVYICLLINYLIIQMTSLCIRVVIIKISYFRDPDVIPADSTKYNKITVTRHEEMREGSTMFKNIKVPF